MKVECIKVPSFFTTSLHPLSFQGNTLTALFTWQSCIMHSAEPGILFANLCPTIAVSQSQSKVLNLQSGPCECYKHSELPACQIV